MTSDDFMIDEIVDESVPWGARDAWWGVVAMGLWLAAALGVALLAYVNSWELDLSLFLALGELSLLIPVWWFVFRKYAVSWEMLGFRRLEGRMVALGCGFLALFYAFNVCYNSILLSFQLEGGQDLSPLFEQPDSLPFVVFSAVILAPLVEEVFFRGFIFTGFREKYGWKKAAAISAVFFSFVHLQLLTALPIFLLGYIFAYVYQKSKSLWLPIILHASVNGVAFLLFGLVNYFNSVG
jgi:hypothetical protein